MTLINKARHLVRPFANSVHDNEYHNPRGGLAHDHELMRTLPIFDEQFW